MKKICSLLVFVTLGFSGSASATMITSIVGFDGGDSLVTFDEVAMANGTIITNQYAPFGVTFSPNLVSESFRTATGFSGQSAANFSPLVNPFTISFTQSVNAFGAYWETNNGDNLIFDAYLGATLIESFNFTEPSCCSTGSFLGFANIIFDSVEISNAGSGFLIMDTLYFSPASVPEPASIVLLFLGLAGAGFQRRKHAA